MSRGKIDSTGTFVPTAADGVIAGFGLPSPAIKLGKRFSFASDPDVHLYLYVDKDAYANDMKYFASGGGVQFWRRTSAGNRSSCALASAAIRRAAAPVLSRCRLGPIT